MADNPASVRTPERLGLPDALTICCVAIWRCSEALGGIWTGGKANVERPVLHEFVAEWRAHPGKGRYIGWMASVSDLYSGSSRWEGVSSQGSSCSGGGRGHD